MGIIDKKTWGDLAALVNEATNQGDFSNKHITWRRKKAVLTEFAEDQDSFTNFEDVDLLVLCNYNFLRSWPVTAETESGQLDRQSIQLMINKQYLRDLGYINSSNYIKYNPDYDRFILDGVTYRAMGDTPASQALDDDLFISIIIQREETFTGNVR